MDYESIINLGRPPSKRPKLGINERAAQFAPFSALTGYEEKIKESSRLTNNKNILDEDKKEILNYRLRIIENRKLEKPLVEIIYFIKDLTKKGGKYQSIKGFIKKIDHINKKIILEDNTIININDIGSIDSEVFNQIY